MKLHTINNQSKTIVEWCAIYGISYATVRTRMFKRGCSLEEALRDPVKRAKPPEKGDRFGRLTVVKSARIPVPEGGTRLLCRCKCECGGIAIVRHHSLQQGNTGSCGCIRREATAERNRARRKAS